MTLLTPGFLIAALAAIVALIVAHLFARARPPELLLPTARFVPAGSARAAARARRPTDRMLLLLRAMMLALLGLAFAKPVPNPRRAAHARVIAVEASRDVADLGAALDSARSLHREGDVLVAFDTVAHPLASADSLAAVQPGTGPGSMSAALIAGIRAASDLAQRADTIELVVISPFRAAAIDSATIPIRATWPGPIRLVRVAAADDVVAAGSIDVRAPAADVLRAGIALAAPTPESEIRVLRRLPDAADSAWSAGANRVLVAWPDEDAEVAFPARAQVDSIGGVVAGGRVVVATFERRWEPPAGHVIARWTDGSPAATEQTHGAGCIRYVAVPLPETGDLVLRREFGLFAGELLVPCGGRRDHAPMSAAAFARLAGRGPAARGASIAAPGSFDPRLSIALLAAALILAAAEQVIRRRGRSPGETGGEGSRARPLVRRAVEPTS